ncbi:O-antigen ligase family protein [Patescibacteria group bacterium]|jgi:O-antigen ligase|nr:O-antigen ligase family protein [Patescibacteria group bacterium]
MSEILAIVGIIFFLMLAHRHFQWALAMLIFLLPSYLWRLDFFGLPSTFLELMILSLFVFWLIKDKKWERINYFWQNPNINPLDKKLKFLLAAWLLLSLGSVFVSFSLSSLGLWRAYFLESLMFFLVFVYSFKKFRDLKTVFWAMSILIFALGTVSLWQYFSAWNLPAAYNFPNIKRLTGLFSYPNALALLVAPLSGFLFALSFKLKDKVEKIAYLLASIVGFVLVLATKSEGALLALAFALFVFVFCQLKQKIYRAGLLALSMFILFFSPLKAYIIQAWQDLLHPVASHFTSSLAIRGLQWQEAVNLLKDHWLFGAGLNNYQTLMIQYHQITWLEIFLYPHNIFLNFWVELGLLGLIVFILLLVYIIQALRKLFLKQHILAWPLALFLIVWFIHGLVDVPYFKNDLSVLFFLFLGLLVIAQKNDQT